VYPQWKLPEIAAHFMPDKTYVKWVCNNKFGYSSWLEYRCSQKLKHTFNRRCLSRSINHDKDFKVFTYEQTKKLIMESEAKDFNSSFLQKIIYKIHSPVHDKLGMYSRAIQRDATRA